MRDDPSPLQNQRRITCPGCGGPSLYSVDNLYRPFCSERCKNIDLGAWANQDFRLPTKDGQEDLLPDDPPPLQ